MISSSGIPFVSTHGLTQKLDEHDSSDEAVRRQNERESRAIDFVREIESLDDRDLLKRLRSMVVKERRSTTQLLAHLAVLDGRRLYIAQGYSSLFNYCTRGLHFSEQAAYLRIEAARVVRRFPAVLARVADGSIHLTALSLLRPHLTTDNHRGLLDAACHRSRREVEDLVAPFRCGPTSRPRARFDVVPPPGNPGDAIRSMTGCITSVASSLEFSDHTLRPASNAPDLHKASPHHIWWSPAEMERSAGDLGTLQADGRGACAGGGYGAVAGVAASGGGGAAGGSVGGAAGGSVGGAAGGGATAGGAAGSGIPGEEVPYYRLHLTISSETRLKLEQARELLRHQVPDGDPAKILDRALGVLLDRLEQRKFARLMARPNPAIGVRGAVERNRESVQAAATVIQTASGSDGDALDRASRDISAAIRREVWYRDDGQCAFVGEDGVRCDRRGALEYHHIVPWASGGATTAVNLALRCRVHNAWESEVSFTRSPTIPVDHRVDHRDGDRVDDRDNHRDGDRVDHRDNHEDDYRNGNRECDVDDKPATSSTPDELGPGRVENGGGGKSRRTPGRVKLPD